MKISRLLRRRLESGGRCARAFILRQHGGNVSLKQKYKARSGALRAIKMYTAPKVHPRMMITSGNPYRRVAVFEFEMKRHVLCMSVCSGAFHRVHRRKLSKWEINQILHTSSGTLHKLPAIAVPLVALSIGDIATVFDTRGGCTTPEKMLGKMMSARCSVMEWNERKKNNIRFIQIVEYFRFAAQNNTEHIPGGQKNLFHHRADTHTFIQTGCIKLDFPLPRSILSGWRADRKSLVLQ